MDIEDSRRRARRKSKVGCLASGNPQPNEGSEVELNAVVFHVRLKHRSEYGSYRVGIRCPEAEEVETARGPMRASSPNDEQRGALEHKARRVVGTRESVEEPFVHEAREDQLEILPALLRLREKPGPHRRGDVLDLLAGHASASR